ncbi:MULTISPECIES: type II secretion system F family protein [Vibrio]|uniref:Type II secretion system F family protein n=1 Tax=Vibrio cortegadensis TaxID=1328770 RepID=A0ABV4M3N0_9VIBR|nr:pilus assembly protein TadB [Vibrionales bacterium C3R12]
MIYWLALIIGAVLLLIVFVPRSKKSNSYLEEINRTVFIDSMDEDKQAVNLNSLSAETLKQRVIRISVNTRRQLGALPEAKVLLFACLLVALGTYLNNQYFRVSWLLVVIIVECLGFIAGYLWLQKREKEQFEESFPDALNMLASAVSAGESIMHAIIFVGKSLDSEVGREFKKMGERLQVGESPDEVFRKSCVRFPYSSFQFFVITLRANMQRGGQLKEVIGRLNRLMFNARAVEKKKYALTSEARTSAKIVGAIPFVFLFMLQYLSPDNYEFVMFNPSGKVILYYVLISEFIGISIIWLLMKGVR